MINEQALINIAAPKGITSSDIDVFCDKTFKRHAMACDELLKCRTELDNDDFFC